jgi:hypothetical protein
MTYIKFSIDVKINSRNKNRFIQKILEFLFPVANPDFEKQITNVSIWMLEFSEIESIPTREIGLDINGIVIAKMPFKKNYGYWVDNTLCLNDFNKLFKVSVIPQGEFETYWDKL